MWKRRLFIPAAAIALAFAACTDAPVAPDTDLEPAAKKAKGGDAGALVDPAAAISDLIDAANAGLAAAGAGYRVVMAEYVTGEGDQAGATVISKDVGNKQLFNIYRRIRVEGSRGFLCLQVFLPLSEERNLGRTLVPGLLRRVEQFAAELLR